VLDNLNGSARGRLGKGLTPLLAPTGNWSLSIRNDANGSNSLPGNRQVDNFLLELIISTALREDPLRALCRDCPRDHLVTRSYPRLMGALERYPPLMERARCSLMTALG